MTSSTTAVGRHCPSGVRLSGLVLGLVASLLLAGGSSAVGAVVSRSGGSGACCPSAAGPELDLAVSLAEGFVTIVEVNKAAGPLSVELHLHNVPASHETGDNDIPAVLQPGDRGVFNVGTVFENDLATVRVYGCASDPKLAVIRTIHLTPGYHTEIGDSCPAGITAQLKRLVPQGAAAKIGTLLKHDGVTLNFSAPEAGNLSVRWYYLPKGAGLAPVLVASGKASFGGVGSRTVRVQLTAAGSRVLRQPRARVIAKTAFRAADGSIVSATTRLKLTKSVK